MVFAYQNRGQTHVNAPQEGRVSSRPPQELPLLTRCAFNEAMMIGPCLMGQSKTTSRSILDPNATRCPNHFCGTKGGTLGSGLERSLECWGCVVGYQHHQEEPLPTSTNISQHPICHATPAPKGRNRPYSAVSPPGGVGGSRGRGRGAGLLRRLRRLDGSLDCEQLPFGG